MIAIDNIDLDEIAGGRYVYAKCACHYAGLIWRDKEGRYWPSIVTDQFPVSDQFPASETLDEAKQILSVELSKMLVETFEFWVSDVMSAYWAVD